MTDFGKTADDYSSYRAGFPEELFERLSSLGVGVPKQRILDLGTGTGSLARGFAHRKSTVTGLDKATALLQKAKQLDEKYGVDITYIEGDAEDTGLDSQSFDIVSAGQCWHWLDSSRAAPEVRRLLAEQGRFLIAYLDWLPLPNSAVELTENIILEHNPSWEYSGGNGLYHHLVDELTNHNFNHFETFSFDLDIDYSHEAWRGRIRASAGIGARLNQQEVLNFDNQLKSQLKEKFPHEVLSLRHRVFALVCQA